MYPELVEELPVFCLLKGVWNQQSVKKRVMLQSLTLALNQKADVDRGVLVEEALTLTINFKVD